jgi:hypothetical protein
MTGGSVEFSGELLAMHGGGHAVAVDPAVAAGIGAKHRSRVKGTFAGAPFRSNLVSMGGGLLLGVHKATVQAAGVAIGDTVEVVMQPDADPLPNDVMPPELQEALNKNEAARSAWSKMTPSHRREYVGYITEAKRPETRARRVASSVQRMIEGGKLR